MIGRRADSTARTLAPCCPELISAYIDGELSPAEQLRMRRHLVACSGCNERYEDYLGVRNLLRSQPDTAVPAAVRRKIEVRLVGGHARPSTWGRVSAVAGLAAGLAALAFTAGLYLADEPTSAQRIAHLTAAPREVQSRLAGSVTLPATATVSPPASAVATDGSGTGSNNTGSVGSETPAINPSAPGGVRPARPSVGESGGPVTAGQPATEPSATSQESAGAPVDLAPTAAPVTESGVVRSVPAGAATAPAESGSLPNLLPRVPGSTGVAATPTVPSLLPFIQATATLQPTQAPPTPIPATAAGTSTPQAPPATATAVPAQPSPTRPAESPGETVAVVRAEPTTPPTPAATRPPAATATATPEPPPPATRTAAPPTAAPTESPARPTVAPTEVVATTQSGESLEGTSLGATAAVRAADECVVPTLPVYATILDYEPAVATALRCALAPAEVAAIQVQTFRGGWLLHPGRPYPVYAVIGTRLWDSLGYTTISAILAAGAPSTLGAPLGRVWAVSGVVQEFEGGIALSGPEGYIFVLLYDGRARVY